MSNILFYIVTILAMILAGLFILTRYLESFGIFFPSRIMAVNPTVMELSWEDVYFRTQDKVLLNGWFIKNLRAKSTLIFAHGNAGNISDRLFKIKFFYDLGLNVFIFDYRGYGKSEGKPFETGVYWDAQGAYDYLQSRREVDMNNIILYGASLGGAVVIDLAGKRKSAFLVVESSITNAQDMAHLLYPFIPSIFLSYRFDSVGKVRLLKMPKLFIHSPEDEVVPFWVGKKLFDAAAEPKEFLEVHGGHNDGSITTNTTAAGEFIRIIKEKELI